MRILFSDTTCHAVAFGRRRDLRSAKGRIRRGERLTSGFTLIELLTVIIMITILVSLLYPAINGAQNQARKVQAKNDLTQMVSAVNAFYTEYGKYPVITTSTNDAYFGTGTTPSGATSYGNNDVLIDVLSNNTGDTNNSTVATLNPRGIVFLNVPAVKNNVSPKSGVIPNGATVTAPLRVGVWYDPWGTPYNVEIDTTYDNSMTNPYGAAGTGGAGPNPLSLGAIAWSFGNDQKPGTKTASSPNGDNVYRNPTTGAQSDDVISWQ